MAMSWNLSRKEMIKTMHFCRNTPFVKTLKLKTLKVNFVVDSVFAFRVAAALCVCLAVVAGSCEVLCLTHVKILLYKAVIKSK